MSSSSEPSSSSLSLILGLRDGSDDAWRKLVDLYAPLVRNWCLYSGVAEHVISDIIQEVFVSVHRSIAKFEPRKSTSGFRGWVWTITRNKIRDHFRIAKTQATPKGGSVTHRQIQSLPDPILPDDAPSEPSDTVALLHRALDMIRVDFQEKTWNMFWRAAVLGHSTEQISEELDVLPATIRQAKSRVLRRLRQQLGDLA